MADTLEELELAYQASGNARAFLPYVKELRRRGRYRDALGVVDAGIEKSGESAHALSLKAQILVDLGEAVKAEEIIRAALKNAPSSFEAQILLVRILVGQRNFPEARAYVETLLRDYPTNPEARALANVVEAEISQTITKMLVQREERVILSNDEQAQLLREQIENLAGVGLVCKFRQDYQNGELYFSNAEETPLDDDIKVLLIECARLATKLKFGLPRRGLLETGVGRMYFRIRNSLGLIALASPEVKLGRLRFLAEEYLRLSEEIAGENE